MPKMTRRTFLRGVAATAALPAASTAFTTAPARAASKPFAGFKLNPLIFIGISLRVASG